MRHGKKHNHLGRTTSHRRAMFLAEDLLPGLPDGFEVLVAEQRPRPTVRDGVTVDIDDSTLFARRRRAD